MRTKKLQLIYLPAALATLDDVLFFSDDEATGKNIVASIDEAISMLARHPEIGRLDQEGRRELVISTGKTGYVALYRYSAVRQRVVISAIRHQRQAGYKS